MRIFKKDLTVSKFQKSVLASAVAVPFLAVALGCGSDPLSEMNEVNVMDDIMDTVSEDTESRTIMNDAIYGHVNVIVKSTTQNTPIEGAEVSLNYRHNGHSVATAMTDGSGVASFTDITAGAEYVVEVRSSGYVTANKALGELLEADETRDISVPMIVANEPFIWEGEDIGGTITTVDDVQITFGSDALVVEETGEEVSGDVTVLITEIDVSNPDHLDAYPGSLIGTYEGGDSGQLHTYGVIDINFYDSEGRYLQLKEGQKVDVVFPISGLQHADGSPVMKDDKIGLWTLDESSGVWIYDSEGTVHEDADGNLFLHGEKTHFSFANIDNLRETDRNYWNVLGLDLTIPPGEGFEDEKPNCLAVKFWIHKKDEEQQGVEADKTVVCADEGDEVVTKKQHFTIPEDIEVTGYCWEVQMMVDGSTGFNRNNQNTIGEVKTFCQDDVRGVVVRNGDCDYLTENSTENNGHCITLIDHIGMDIQFGITYSMDANEFPIYDILTPDNMVVDYKKTVRTENDAEGYEIITTLDEGKRLNCKSVCESPLRADSRACTEIARDNSC